jgi:hypothetical protein
VEALLVFKAWRYGQRVELVLRELLVRLELVLRPELDRPRFRLPLRLADDGDVWRTRPSKSSDNSEAPVLAWPMTSFARRVKVPFVASA